MKRRTFIGAMTATLLGVVGVSIREMIDPDSRSVMAARRPTPTPAPIKCPGIQKPLGPGGACICPPDQPNQAKCGPTCCATAAQCCDNACCNAGTHCCGEEICCPD